jgi:CubicO group peptidase (beta-lactamase class C family)
MEILKPILMAGVDPLASPQTTLHRQVLALHGVVGRPPGTFAYSNANYEVLVDVIENVTGTSCARPISVETATPTASAQRPGLPATAASGVHVRLVKRRPAPRRAASE